MSTVHTGAPTAVSTAERPLVLGDVVGEYVIEGELGKGGFGTVYAAVHPLIGKRAAIKVLSSRYSADEIVVSRFVAEARAVNQIRHQNIIDIFAFGALLDGRHYYVMELLEGESLEHYLRTKGRLSVAEALPILTAIAKALDAAHAKGIAHRDLKPENIFLAIDDDHERFPKLLDFGIAKLLTGEEPSAHRTATGAPIGTPSYMSPEQCRGKDVDHRTDIYSFGIVAYRLLTGELPFEADGYVELMMLQLNEQPIPPSARNPQLSPGIDHAIAAMMNKEPGLRPETVTRAVAAMSAAPGVTGDASRASAVALLPTMIGAAPLGPARSSLAGWWIAAAVLGVGAVLAYALTRSAPLPVASAPPIQSGVTMTEAPGSSGLASISVDASMDASSPLRVIVHLAGAPDGTEVSAGATRLGYAPMFQIERGVDPLVVTLVAEGFVPLRVALTPDRDQELQVTMKVKARAKGSRPRGNKDDIIHDIPGLTP